jgi:endonuclease/exonuclease/phosphatase family metal-dependent hydrolase
MDLADSSGYLRFSSTIDHLGSKDELISLSANRTSAVFARAEDDDGIKSLSLTIDLEVKCVLDYGGALAPGIFNSYKLQITELAEGESGKTSGDSTSSPMPLWPTLRQVSHTFTSTELRTGCPKPEAWLGTSGIVKAVARNTGESQETAETVQEIAVTFITPSGPRDFRVMVYNIASGSESWRSSWCDMERQAEIIAMEQPAIVVLDEVYRFTRVGGHCNEDQPELLRAALKRRGWSYDARFLQTGKTLSDGGLAGKAILSRYVIRGFHAPPVAGGSLLRVTVFVEDLPVTVLAIKMSADGNDSDSEGARIAQASAIVKYAKTFSGPVIVAGDFNALPNSPSRQRFTSAGFTDPWLVLGHPAEVAPGDNYDRFDLCTARRIDYVLYRKLRYKPIYYKGCFPNSRSDHPVINVYLIPSDRRTAK